MITMPVNLGYSLPKLKFLRLVYCWYFCEGVVCQNQS